MPDMSEFSGSNAVPIGDTAIMDNNELAQSELADEEATSLDHESIVSVSAATTNRDGMPVSPSVPNCVPRVLPPAATIIQEVVRASPAPIDLEYTMNLEDLEIVVDATNIAAESSDSVPSPPPLPRLPPQSSAPPPKRIVASARECYPLLGPGMRQMRDEINSKVITSEPQVFGLDIHYDTLDIFGATSEVHHRRVGTTRTSSTSPNAATHQAHPFSLIFLETEETKSQARPRLDCDLSKYSYPLRISDKKIWPASNVKLVASVKSAALMMVSSPIVDLMRLDGIIPLLKHRKDKDGYNLISNGAYLNDNGQPHPPGFVCPATTAYRDFGMILHSGFNEVLKSRPLAAGALIFRLPEKNYLPIGTPEKHPMSPYAEICRIKANEQRQGFDFYRSGGNWALKGQAPPTVTSKKAGEGAYFEHEQSIDNPYNFAIEQLADYGIPVAVFLAGPLFLASYSSKDNEQQEKGKCSKQAVYCGVYRVEALAQQKGLSKAQLQQIMIDYADIYPDMAEKNLGFLKKLHRRYRLVPIEYPKLLGGYSFVQVDVEDDRRPTFAVFKDASFDSAFAWDQAEDFDEDAMFTKWYKEGGYLEFVDRPFVRVALKKSKHTSSRMKSHDNSIESLLSDVPLVDQVQSPFRLLEPSDKPSSRQLSSFVVSSQTKLEHWWIALATSVATFLRSFEVNVDSSGRVGPLLDYNPSYHIRATPTDLPSYEKVFGITKCTPYTRYLGLEIQRSPSTHPVRLYDPNRMLLIESNGGGSMRSSRKGLEYFQESREKSIDLLFQSILVEVVRVQVLLEWSLFNGFTNQLPLVKDIPAFLEFAECLCIEHKWRSPRHILQTQYEIHDGFSFLISFKRLFTYLSTSLTLAMSSMIAICLDKEEPSTDKFAACRTSLGNFFAADLGLGSHGSKMDFFCQHILMNVNELICGWPFSKPIVPIFGFGGQYGAKMLQMGSSDQKMGLPKVMEEMLAFYKARPVEELELMGLKKDSTGSVVIEINGRDICCIEPEHFGCINFGYTERQPGRSRGSGQRYEVTSPHCHPVRTSTLSTTLALKVGKKFKSFVDSGKWRELINEMRPEMNMDFLLPDTSNAINAEASRIANVNLEESKGSEAMVADNAQTFDDDSDDSNAVGNSCRSSNDSDDNDAFLDSKRLQESMAIACSDMRAKRSAVLLPASVPPAKRMNTKTGITIIDIAPYPAVAIPLVADLVVGVEAVDPVIGVEEPGPNLMLGMIYGAMDGTPETIADSGDFTSQLRRDTARCVATERICGRKVFTIDNREGDSFRRDRHIRTDIAQLQMHLPLLRSLAGTVHQICLDHFWFSPVYWDERGAGGSFFSKSVPYLHSLLEDEGSIYLGICAQIFAGLAKNRASTELLFSVSLVLRQSVLEIDLVRGSHSIPDELYESKKLGPKGARPESKFQISYSMIEQTIGSFAYVTSVMVRDYLKELVCKGYQPEDYAFIKLTKLLL